MRCVYSDEKDFEKPRASVADGEKPVEATVTEIPSIAMRSAGPC